MWIGCTRLWCKCEPIVSACSLILFSIGNWSHYIVSRCVEVITSFDVEWSRIELSLVELSWVSKVASLVWIFQMVAALGPPTIKMQTRSWTKAANDSQNAHEKAREWRQKSARMQWERPSMHQKAKHSSIQKQSISKVSLERHLHKCNKMHTIPRILIVAFFHNNVLLLFFVRFCFCFCLPLHHRVQFRSNRVVSVESRSRTWAHSVHCIICVLGFKKLFT